MRTRLRAMSAAITFASASLGLLVGCAVDTAPDDAGTTGVIEQPLSAARARPAKAKQQGHGHRGRSGPGPGRGHGHGHGHGPAADGGAGGAPALDAGGSDSDSEASDDGTASGGGPAAPGSGGTSTGSNAAGADCGSSTVAEGSADGGSEGGMPGVGDGGGYYDEGECGDGSLQWNESCDDGNTVDGDGCSSDCGWEAGWACDWGSPSSCHPTVCGDGLLEGSEQCDDGNQVAADGCSDECRVEAGFVCESAGSPCRVPVCGDGKQDYYVAADGVERWEQCDDGNAVADDGCSAECEIEAGFVCDGPGLPCRQARCGDGYQDWIPAGGSGGLGTGGTSSTGDVTEGGAAGDIDWGTWEECDDSNTTSGDGCSETCTLEPGWSCYSPGGPCHVAVCGDGIVDWTVEECDDGNANPDDGCDECRWDSTFWGEGGASWGVGGAPSTGGTVGFGGDASEGGESG